MEQISYDDFAKLDLRVGQVLEAEVIEGATKLLRLLVDIGDEKRQVVAGIREVYGPEDLIGRKLILLCNLKPVTLRGVKSEGMILAAGGEKVTALSAFDRDVEVGSKVR